MTKIGASRGMSKISKRAATRIVASTLVTRETALMKERVLTTRA
jgi:hypothetical protein